LIGGFCKQPTKHLERIDMKRKHLEITRHLLELVDRDELMLPTLPEVAMRIREAANDPALSRNCSEPIRPFLHGWCLSPTVH